MLAVLAFDRIAQKEVTLKDTILSKSELDKKIDREELKDLLRRTLKGFKRAHAKNNLQNYIRYNYYPCSEDEKGLPTELNLSYNSSLSLKEKSAVMSAWQNSVIVTLAIPPELTEAICIVVRGESFHAK